MQKVKEKCMACGGDGMRESVGDVETNVSVYTRLRCTRCKGSGMEPKPDEATE